MSVQNEVTTRPRETTETLDRPASQRHHQTYVQSLQIPQKPLIYRFAKQRRSTGLRNLAASVLAIGIGGFLVTHVPTSPTLQVQVALLAASCCLIGCYLLPTAVRDLMGRMEVDANGIRVRPRLFGFTVPWDQLTRWEVDIDSFRFVTPKSIRPYTTELSNLSQGECLQLRDVLREAAPEREGASNRI